MPIVDKLKKAWNAFRDVPDERYSYEYSEGVSYGYAQPSQKRSQIYNDRSIVSAICTRISIDVSTVDIRHVRLDEIGRYSEDVKSQLNSCLTFEPNMDQSPAAMKRDLVLTLFDKGCAALVPIDTTIDPETNQVFDIFTLRVGYVVKWMPKHVKVSVWNEEKGRQEEVTLEKRVVALVENPLYAVMNEPNSTLQRLIKKLGILDTVDEAMGSGKLDIIIQLPYVVKSEAMRQRAEKRRDEIEFQLKGSKYGIAYTDGTEKITQLNRPAENNLLKQIEMLIEMLYGQLGITAEVMNGTADEKTMINYWNRTIEPILEAAVQEMQRKFVGFRGARKAEKISYFRDPFKLVPLSNLAEIVDKFTRNEIFSSNEVRGFLGIRPSKDPKADQLVNSNMPQPAAVGENVADIDAVMNEVFDGLEADIDKLAGKSSDG